MSSLDDPNGGLADVTVSAGDLVAIRLDRADDFRQRCPDLFDDLIEMTAFVNWRCLDRGDAPLLALIPVGAF